MEKRLKKRPVLNPTGHTVFILECADGSYFSGFTSDLEERIKKINSGEGGFYFLTNKGKLPIKSVKFKEEHLPFREAYAKHLYLRTLTRRYRIQMIETGKWPLGRALRRFWAECEHAP